MPNIILQNHRLTYSLSVDKRRSSIQIVLKNADEVVIKAPLKLSTAKIETYLLSHADWLLDRIKSMQQATSLEPINHGSEIPVLGQLRTLTLIPRQIKKVELSLLPEQLILRYPRTLKLTKEYLYKLLTDFYIKMATGTLQQKTAHWCNIIGVKPLHISIRDPKTRWGSCSSRGTISYNWRIVMAPEHIIDYLVVHELCHLKVPNHSALFWQHVHLHIPNYKECRKWLKNNANLLCKVLKY